MILACSSFARHYDITDLALALINTGESNPGAQNLDGNTALMVACNSPTYMKAVVLALINTGKSNIGIQSHDGKTALMYACMRKRQDLAMTLIQTGKSNPGAIDKNEESALIYACMYKLNDVALELLRIDNLDIEGEKLYHAGALFWAKKNRMTDVFDIIIEKLGITVNTDDTCFDIISGEDIPIKDAILHNVVFIFYENNINSSFKVCIDINSFNKAYQNMNDYIIYECLEEDSMRSVNRKVKYIDIKKITGFGDLILKNDFDYIYKNIDTKIFAFKRTKQQLHRPERKMRQTFYKK